MQQKVCDNCSVVLHNRNTLKEFDLGNIDGERSLVALVFKFRDPKKEAVDICQACAFTFLVKLLSNHPNTGHESLEGFTRYCLDHSKENGFRDGDMTLIRNQVYAYQSFVALKTEVAADK